MKVECARIRTIWKSRFPDWNIVAFDHKSSSALALYCHWYYIKWSDTSQSATCMLFSTQPMMSQKLSTISVGKKAAYVATPMHDSGIVHTVCTYFSRRASTSLSEMILSRNPKSAMSWPFSSALIFQTQGVPRGLRGWIYSAVESFLSTPLLHSVAHLFCTSSWWSLFWSSYYLQWFCAFQRPQLDHQLNLAVVENCRRISFPLPAPKSFAW